MDALENQLKEARFLAEEADKKYDEVQLRNRITWLWSALLGCCVFGVSCVILVEYAWMKREILETLKRFFTMKYVQIDLP